MSAFKIAHASAEDWAHAAQACIDGLGDLPRGANFGFVYVTDTLSEDVPNIVAYLRQRTGIQDWVGSVGIGICGGDEEYFDRSAIAVMTASFPDGAFRLFPALSHSVDQLSEDDMSWIAEVGPTFGFVHGCPNNAETPALIADLSEATAAFLAGGITSSRWSCSQIAGRLTGGGVSGVLMAPEIGVATTLSQGCSAIGRSHIISDCLDNVVIGLDGHKAMDVMAEDLRGRVADDPLSAARNIHVGLTIGGSDTGDYLVRDIVGMDPARGWIAIGENVLPGERIRFVERDEISARADLESALHKLKKRLSGPPRGVVYISCISRGPAMFGQTGTEIRLVREALGRPPIVGFFGNGEISNNRLYGYTGVVIAFT